MKLHRGCITDPVARSYWRDYQQLLKDGNPQGLSFTEYVATRVDRPQILITFSAEDTSAAPWYVATCGHKHPWGQSCSMKTVAQ